MIQIGLYLTMQHILKLVRILTVKTLTLKLIWIILFYGLMITSMITMLIAFKKIGSILKLESLSNDPLFLTNKQRVLNREQLTTMLSDAIKLFQKDELLKLCENKNVPAGPINTMEEVFQDPQVIFREMQLNFGHLQGVASPFKFSDAKLNMQTPSPRLGQDDTEF